MKVTEKKLKNGNVQLEAIASSGEVSRAFGVAQNRFARKMGLKMEKGQSVEQAARETMGIRDLDSVVAPQVPGLLAPFAIDARNLTPAFDPQPTYAKLPRRGQSFSFTLEVMPRPEFELESYEPVTIKVKPKKDPDIDAELDRLAENSARFETAEPHAVGEGDSFKLAIDALQNGEPLKNLNSEGRTYIMGQGLMPLAFEQQLYGMEVGETKQFTFELDSNKPGADPDVIDCTVTVIEQQRKVKPVIDDAWVQENLPRYETLEGLRAAMERSMGANADEAYETEKLNAAVTELARRFKSRIDGRIIQASEQNLRNNMRTQIEAQGRDFDEYVRAQGGEEAFNMTIMIQTRADLQRSYSLDALYRHEGLTITDDDIDLAVRELSPQYADRLREDMEANGQGYTLRELAERYKANRWLLDHAIVEVEEA